jgi:hypothetical protein
MSLAQTGGGDMKQNVTKPHGCKRFTYMKGTVLGQDEVLGRVGAAAAAACLLRGRWADEGQLEGGKDASEGAAWGCGEGGEEVASMRPSVELYRESWGGGAEEGEVGGLGFGLKWDLEGEGPKAAFDLGEECMADVNRRARE